MGADELLIVEQKAGRADLAGDERFRLMSGRIVNRGTLIPIISDIESLILKFRTC